MRISNWSSDVCSSDLLALKVTPRANREAVEGLTDTGGGKMALAVRVGAAPSEGAANEAVLKLITRRLDMPPSPASRGWGGSERRKRGRREGGGERSGGGGEGGEGSGRRGRGGRTG